MRIIDKALSWFYCTRLGGLVFDFLLWKDRHFSGNTYLNPSEVQQIIKNYSLTTEGVTSMKVKINSLLRAKSKEDYNRTLAQIEDLIPYSDPKHLDPNMQNLLSALRVGLEKNKDVVTLTDKAKMIDKRINHMYELQEDKLKRQLMRDIRKAEQDDKELAEKLKSEYLRKYGRSSSGLRRS